MPTVLVKFFGPARDLAGSASIHLEIDEDETLGTIAGKIAVAVPKLAERTGLRLAVNRAYVPLNHRVSAGDEIAIIPPVSGGAPGPAPGVELTRNRIEIDKILETCRSRVSGAIATFAGNVRAENREGVALVSLEYHAYEEMALSLMAEIRARAIERFALTEAVIIHRLGVIELAETSILVIAASPHRAEAFDACRWIVDAVKNDVPIWKKELWADNRSEWVEA